MLDGTLAGTSGTTVAERAQNGAVIPGSQRVDQPAVDGRNVRLTIDADIQWYAQNALAKQVTAVGAETGTAIVLELATGKIRAAASYPTFDPNDLRGLQGGPAQPRLRGRLRARIDREAHDHGRGAGARRW